MAKKEKKKSKKKAVKKRKTKCNFCNDPFLKDDLTEIPFKASPDAPEIKLKSCGPCLMKSMSNQGSTATGEKKKKSMKEVEALLGTSWEKDEYKKYEEELVERKKKAAETLKDKLGTQWRDDCEHYAQTHTGGKKICKDCGIVLGSKTRTPKTTKK